MPEQASTNFAQLNRSLYPFIVAIFCGLLLLSNVGAVKLIEFGPIITDGGAFLFPLVYITGDVPLGAGLSSSAAVECATAYALNYMNDLNISAMDLALIAQSGAIYHQKALVLSVQRTLTMNLQII